MDGGTAVTVFPLWCHRTFHPLSVTPAHQPVTPALHLQSPNEKQLTSVPARSLFQQRQQEDPLIMHLAASPNQTGRVYFQPRV